MASSTKSKICFFFQSRVQLPERTRLKAFLESIFRKETKRLRRINYIFCTDQQLLGINREYLKHDYYTDIITFELSPHGDPVEAEVYISVDRVKDNARNLGETIKMELHRVIFHGALHLCGHGDKTVVEKKKMRALEDFYLQRYFK
jgi:rRNA maturation RNase YbeY